MQDARKPGFSIAAPAGLARLNALTPGDFAVVARQVKVTGPIPAEALLARLEAELAVKPGGMAPIGFWFARRAQTLAFNLGLARWSGP